MSSVLKNEDKNKVKNNYEALLLLHNDPEVNGFFVIESLINILGLSEELAVEKTMEAHYFSIAVLGSYPLEIAEFYSEQFCKIGILVTYKK